MSKRWYEYWLYKASNAEREGRKKAALLYLDQAERHTDDPEELRYLNGWQRRLRRELATKR